MQVAPQRQRNQYTNDSLTCISVSLPRESSLCSVVNDIGGSACKVLRAVLSTLLHSKGGLEGAALQLEGKP